MPPGLYFNASNEGRTWNALQNFNTGRTLYLDPGEQAEVNVPDGFSDPWLQRVSEADAVPEASTPKKSRGAKPTGAEPLAEDTALSSDAPGDPNPAEAPATDLPKE